MTRNRFALVLVCAALSIAAVGQLAAQSDGPEVRLSLDQCLRTALANNLDLVLARMDPAISEEAVTQQAAAFDGSVNAIGFGNGFETEPSDEFTSAGIGRTLGGRGQYLQDFQFGGDLDVQLTSSRRTGAGSIFFLPPSNDVLRDMNGNIIAQGPGLNEEFYTTSLDLTFNVPLLRGLGIEPTTERLILAKGDLETSREELRRQAELTMEEVEGAYWNLAAAIRALEVSRQSLERAKDLLALNEKKVEVGTLAPIEITQAKAGVADVQEDVIVAEETVENAEDELLRLLAVDAGSPMWDQSVIPADRPEFAPRTFDLDVVIQEALRRRPEMATARQELRNRELSERVSKNSVKHGLDLSVTLTPLGNNINIEDFDSSAGNTPSQVASPAVGSIGDSFSEAAEGDFFTWQGSLVYSIPIRNRAAKAGYRIAQLNRQKADVGLRNQEQTIRVEVRRAVRAVDSGVLRVNAAQANVTLQREKLDAEQKKFQNGMSTSFQVLEFQTDLSEAELSRIRALLDYFKSLAALERVKGTLLGARGLSL